MAEPETAPHLVRISVLEHPAPTGPDTRTLDTEDRLGPNRHPFEAGLDRCCANFGTALADDVPAPGGGGVRAQGGGDPRRAPHHLRRTIRAMPAAGLGAGAPAWDGRHGGDPGAQHPRDARGALRRADARRRAEPAQHRLDAATIAFILRHAEAKVLIVDREFAPLIAPALAAARPQAAGGRHRRRAGRRGERSARSTTRRCSPTAIRRFPWRGPDDEWQAICAELHLGHDRQSEGRRC